MTKEKPWLAIAAQKDKVIYALLFLFPVAGVSVRSWFSGVFVLLVLIAIWDLFKGNARSPLRKEERIWLWLCGGFFATFLVSALANGWGDNQTRHLGVDIRYLLVVPLFIMLRQYPLAWRYLIGGILLAAPVLAIQSYYDLHVLGLQRAQGPYSPNLLGPFAALVAVWTLSSWDLWKKMRWLLPVLAAGALFAVVMSGSRGAYLGLLVMLLAWAGLSTKGWWRAAAITAILVAPMLAYSVIPSVSNRVDLAINEVEVYFERLERGERYAGGTAVRFEMWRAGWMMFKEAPILGIGRGNYTEEVRRHIGNNGLSPRVAAHDHAHNAYIDVAISRGTVGLLIFAGMLFYPLFYLFRTFRQSPDTAIFGILHIVGFAVFSFTDASPFIKGNFVAVYLVFMSVFLSWHAGRIGEAGRPERRSP